MSVNSYLTNLANDLIIRDNEKESIKKSYSTLEYRLNSYFEDKVGFISKFGSYSRETILPRSYDSNSDVDVMVRFNDDSFMPQTYLNRLRNFAECRYSRSEIYQSNPTLVLELNHIKFELVPCIFSDNNSLGIYKIPAKASNYEKWLYTSPFDFNEQLTEKNKQHNWHIKRLIRIMKLWNKKGISIYSSFELESIIVNSRFYGCLFAGNAQLKDYFYEFVSELNNTYLLLPYQYQRDKVKKLVDKVQEIKNNEYYYPNWAESQLKAIFE